jgi:hypothetical protein
MKDGAEKEGVVKFWESGINVHDLIRCGNKKVVARIRTRVLWDTCRARVTTQEALADSIGEHVTVTFCLLK